MNLTNIILGVSLGAFLMSGCGGEDVGVKSKILSDDEKYTQPNKIVRDNVSEFVDENTYNIENSDDDISFKIHNYSIDAKGHTQFFIDIDSDSQTGYNPYGENIGSEYVVEDNRLYKYTGDGKDWTWDMISLVDTQYFTFIPNSSQEPSYKYEDNQWVEQGMVSNPFPYSYINVTVPLSLLPDIQEVFITKAFKINANWNDSTQTPSQKYIIHKNLMGSRLMLANKGTGIMGVTFNNFENSIQFKQFNLEYNHNNYKHMLHFLDIDNNNETGYMFIGGGFEYLLEDNRIYKYKGGNSTEWNWEEVGLGTYSTYLKSSIDFTQDIIGIGFMKLDENWTEISYSRKVVEFNLAEIAEH